MKKIYILTLLLAFAGITAYSLNSSGNGCETDPKKAVAAVAQSECGDGSGAVISTAVNSKETGCCSSSAAAVNAVLTAGSEKAGCSGSSVEAVRTASTECGETVNVVLTAGSEKAGCCSSSDAAVQAVASEECSGEKVKATSIAENQ